MYNHNRILQLSVSPTVATFSTPNSSVPDGFIVLNGFEFTGHAMFSGVDIPIDAGTVEYAWLMQIVVGDISSHLHPTQVCEFLRRNGFFKSCRL